mmetsp:Transcript_96799/g.211704  ORF Transcript_96799/g.211704 Transcript_96799/m.211704 type:complete len:147 (+) Transcript_96799:1248-1688(+)
MVPLRLLQVRERDSRVRLGKSLRWILDVRQSHVLRLLVGQRRVDTVRDVLLQGDLTKSITEIADELVSTGFTGNGDFLVAGATTTTLSPEDKVGLLEGDTTTSITTTTTEDSPGGGTVGLGVRQSNLVCLQVALLVGLLTFFLASA